MTRRHGDTAAPSQIEVTVNGEPLSLPDGSTVADVVRAVVGTRVDSSKGIAVALEREVVPRSAWNETVIGPAARIEVVTAAAGG